MAEGRGREEWAHTSLIAAILANANRDPKKGRALKPDDFNPYATRRGGNDAIEVNTNTIGLMRQAFAGGAT